MIGRKKNKTIVTVTGIRPDFIRMSEIIRRLDAESSFEHILVHTGQHYDEMLSSIFFKDLNIRKPDYNLLVGGEKKSHYHQQALLSTRIIELFQQQNITPDVVLFLGDSNSVLASVSVRKEGYKVGHVEAGMRSYDERMLEEINRKVCDHVSNYLFVYHKNYRKKALREGIDDERIFVIGNTIVEPLRRIADLSYEGSDSHILLDIHRPENFQYPSRLAAILMYARQYSEYFDLPVKMLSFGRTMAEIEHNKIDIGNIEPIPLKGYKDFIRLQQDSKFIISDSGTAQEEPALLGIPVVVPREFTERPESVDNNCSYMLNLNDGSYLSSLSWLESSVARSIDWLGDGSASQSVVDTLKEVL